MELLLGATMDPEGRSQQDVPARHGRQGAFPLHAVERGSQEAVCGAPVRQVLEQTWPPGQESRCADCETVLARAAGAEETLRPEHPAMPHTEQNTVRPYGEP